MTDIQAYAALEAGAELVPFSYDPGPIGAHEVEIEISSCGLCHSDVSMINNDWRASRYPLVPGHEIVGKISAIGGHVKHLDIGYQTHRPCWDYRYWWSGAFGRAIRACLGL